jgi:ATP/maltotriose-dependent transcriptional regulator MalT
VQFEYLAMIRAASALKAGKPVQAIEALAPAVPYELGSPAQALTFSLYPAYLRGEAYVAAHQSSVAAAEFQKIIDHSGVAQNEPIAALAHLGLARAYALFGDPAKAKTGYQDFLALWKNADPDLPILQQAKTEYARLQ